ncbi:STAS domain-containing protein [Bowmanella denitrificans]|uniref:STAS domain-containing protein n=1 Tax=Bowmanella denitrificans TaxID=366582 RepID=A0ABP3GZD0_9ALTE|nr:STAS domain-containing protein [Bowmanella denitrificans]
MSDIHVISLPERFDFSFHGPFTQGYQGVIDSKSAKHIVLDFSRVAYLDSSALGMMVLLQKRASAAGIKASIRGAKGTAQEILNMANMQKIYGFA